MPDFIQVQSLTEAFLHELPPAIPVRTLPEAGTIASWIDHTLLKADATSVQIEQLCKEAIEFQFASVCINPVFVSLASKFLAESAVKVCTVIGFPLGATLSNVKASETLACLRAGAGEVDMVLHIGALKGADFQHVYEDILGVVEAARTGAALVKVIIETSALTRKEKISACLISKIAGVDFVKTSTGFGSGGATVEDVDLMYRISAPEVKVKASGGIRTLSDARAMILAGASRLGTSSGVNIVREAINQDGLT